ncbi:MAG: hypothetical protein A2289_16860 [Deltaproteobacteria bacterium RIFOXYA12_FULL_58_15]|nr:MAG: hypothetical protein A2289_16860 [Deltaproteobacteria bacterium RIFOXYA12_FULL_58_15]OGR10301.1 MAG: hypothetical protein A2341_16890 [Deltaproteobacteria bacterium RIFOXYB12_FULL_58_9]
MQSKVHFCDDNCEDIMHRVRLFLLSIAAVMMLGSIACADDDDKGNGKVDVPFVIKSVRIDGTVSEAAAVTIEQQDDIDGTDNSTWSATYELDGAARPTSMPLDDGKAQSFSVVVKSKNVSDGTEDRKRITLNLSE